jgi:hypothetical protein
MPESKAVTLDEFCDEMVKEIERFRATWRKEHAKNPKHWPLEFAGDNAGAWFEQFDAFYKGCEY